MIPVQNLFAKMPASNHFLKTPSSTACHARQVMLNNSPVSKAVLLGGPHSVTLVPPHVFQPVSSKPVTDVRCQYTLTAPSGSSTLVLERPVVQPAQPAVELAEGRALKEWIEQQGGYIHPALRLVQAAPCGCRGVVVTQNITTEEASEPLIVVPERLYLTTEAARQLLSFAEKQLGSSGSSNKLQLSGLQQLSLLLAHERAKGADSFWAPYIASLPKMPPCAWLMQPSDLAQALLQLQGSTIPGFNVQAWGQATIQARLAIEQQAERMATAYGEVLGVTQEDLVWALGQMLSRCFGSEPDVAAAPYIDLCNHMAGAAQPQGLELDGEVFAYVDGTVDGQPRALQAGDELYVSYMSRCTPLHAFLSFGFVPLELAKPRR